MLELAILATVIVVTACLAATAKWLKTPYKENPLKKEFIFGHRVTGVVLGRYQADNMLDALVQLGQDIGHASPDDLERLTDDPRLGMLPGAVPRPQTK